jgi:hypothetical protein
MSLDRFLNKRVKVIYKDGDMFVGKLNKPNCFYYVNFILIAKNKIKRIEAI